MPPANVILTYFDGRGRAEIIRWVLAQAGVKYVDKRISQSDWPALKSRTPTGTLPVLNVDGQEISQSAAIATYLASEYGLLGSNSLEAAKIRMIFDSVSDTFNFTAKATFTSDKEQQAELFKQLAEEQIPKLLDILKVMLSGGKQWLVGDKVSLADIAAVCFLSDRQEPACVKSINSVAEVKDLMKRVTNLPNIKKWCVNRPVTPL